MAFKTQLTWINVDTTTLTGKSAELFAKQRAMYAELVAVQEAFQVEFLKGQGIPAGKQVKFSFKRGLAVALDTASKGSVKGAVAASGKLFAA